MPVRRDQVAFWASAALLVGAATGAYLLLLGRGPAPVAGPPPSPGPVPVVVASVSGRAEVLRRGGGRAPLASGDRLAPDDAVATGPGARLELAAGESYHVVLDGASRFGIEEITQELSRFRLEEGRVSATVRDDAERAVEIASVRDAVARTRGGEVSVLRSGPVVAVGVARGQAEFRSAGRTVLLRSGQQSAAAEGAAPTSPAPIPPSLLLKVAWPEEQVTAQRSFVVTGRASPGAQVAVGAVPVPVAPDGAFRHVVELSEGAQRLTVSARDVAGRREVVRSPEIVLDTGGPEAEFDTKELWRAETQEKEKQAP
ncbi:MAG TPA: FecR domain-containing protein [Anaeromyxobacteraceae bacterium]|nr:FecR domain-containing protein [Anaeromyxobacteraceae bacterium]